MKIRNLLILLLTISFSVSAQRKKKESNPSATSASQRWDGYQQRLAIEKSSLVKNVPFRNVGPTVMSGRVVDLAVDPNCLLYTSPSPRD